MRFVMDGEMPEYLLAKDLILQVCRFVGEGCLVGCLRGKGGCSLEAHPAGVGFVGERCLAPPGGVGCLEASCS
jgi:hypothetical protein